MNLFIIILIIVILLVTLYPKSHIFYLKKNLIPLMCITFIVCLILFSKTAVESALKGINLCINIVFPSLFPFFVASDLLNRTNFIRATGIILEPIMRPIFNVPGCGSFPVAMGITSGYPMGAKLTTDLREKGQVSKIEGERLLAFTNNSGPLFIVGAVATGMFKMPSIGLFLLVSHILAGLTVGIIFRFYGSKSIKSNKNMKNNSTNNGYWQRFKKEAFGNDKKNNSFGELFGEAIRNSVLLMLSIGGFIIFFSVVINLLIDTGFINYISTVISYVFSPIGLTKETINSLLCGFFEITTGTNMISKATDLSLISKLSFASLVIGWAGLSVHSQVSSIISKSDLSIKPYLIGKCLHGIIACIYSFTALKLLGNLTFDLSVFANTGEIKIAKWYNSLLYSCKNLAFIILLFLLIYILIYFSNKLSRNKASYNNKTL